MTVTIQSGVFPNLDDVDHTFYGDKQILEFSSFHYGSTCHLIFIIIIIITGNINTIFRYYISNFLKNIHQVIAEIYLISLENVTVLIHKKGFKELISVISL